jgi:hypothetical protein
MSFIFGQKQQQTATPAPVARMPVPGEKDRLAAMETRRRMLSRRGRSSTILTNGSRGEAGTTAYGNSLLGQAG